MIMGEEGVDWWKSDKFVEEKDCTVARLEEIRKKVGAPERAVVKFVNGQVWHYVQVYFVLPEAL